MGRILVVEDEFLLADRIGELLENNGFEVVGPAGTQDEALRLAGRALIDGALLDVNIAGGTIDAVADILAARGVPFVFVTAQERDDLPARFREQTIVAKPFEDGLLVDHVRSLTSGWRA